MDPVLIKRKNAFFENEDSTLRSRMHSTPLNFSTSRRIIFLRLLFISCDFVLYSFTFSLACNLYLSMSFPVIDKRWALVRCVPFCMSRIFCESYLDLSKWSFYVLCLCLILCDLVNAVKNSGRSLSFHSIVSISP